MAQRIRGESSLRTWLHRIAFHEYTHRRRQQRPALPLPEQMASPLFEANSLLALDPDRAFACVPEDFRAAFVLCDVQQLSRVAVDITTSGGYTRHL